MSIDTDELVRLWGTAMSQSEIARKLHTTPGAVAGKVDRLRAKGFDLPRRASCNQKNQRKVVVPGGTLRIKFNPSKIAVPPTPPPAYEITVKEISFDDHEEYHCQLVTRPGFYCGGRHLPGRPYCEVHNAGKTIPQQVRQRR